jgi:protein-arginine kinase activator protein McsA
MVCDCCQKRKKLFESFAAINHNNTQINLCAECNDLAYKLRDAANEHKKDDFNKYLNEWKKRLKKPSNSFLYWEKDFIAPLEEKLNESE